MMEINSLKGSACERDGRLVYVELDSGNSRTSAGGESTIDSSPFGAPGA
jgi:hypothetical protein